MEWGRYFIILLMDSMDAFQHLNNVWHVRYFENGRFDFLDNVFSHHLTKKQIDDFRFATGVGKFAP
jgi:acyl-CoA thioesterase FadM